MFEELTKRPSAMVLIIANLVPLVGVVFWHWDVFSIVVLYWMENLVIGATNVLKMITCRPDIDQPRRGGALPGLGAGGQRDEVLRQLEERGGLQAAMRGHAAIKLFLIPFFCVHYFGFCAGHGIFVFSMFGSESGFGRVGGGLFASFGKLPDLLAGSFGVAAAGLLASHLYSFVANYLGRGEYQRTVVPALMFKPYGRIVVLHIAIIFGGFLVMTMGSPAGLLLVLVAGKTVLDLAMHLREHRASPPVGQAAVPGG